MQHQGINLSKELEGFYNESLRTLKITRRSPLICKEWQNVVNIHITVEITRVNANPVKITVTFFTEP